LGIPSQARNDRNESWSNKLTRHSELDSESHSSESLTLKSTLT